MALPTEDTRNSRDAARKIQTMVVRGTKVIDNSWYTFLSFTYNLLINIKEEKRDNVKSFDKKQEKKKQSQDKMKRFIYYKTFRLESKSVSISLK